MKSVKRLSLFSVCFLLLVAVISCRNHSPNANSVTDPTKLSKDLVNITASASSTTPGKLPKMVFTDTAFDFGNIKDGDKVTHVFMFKNEGEGDLVITGAAAGCSCTTPTYPHGVKHAGDTGTISVTFDSSNKQGKIIKRITVSSNNVPPYKFLTITANVQPSNN